MKIRAKPRIGPAATLSSQSGAAMRTVCHQRPRTSRAAAAEGLADRLVGEEDFLLDEEPGDVFVDRDGEADHGDRQQEEAKDRQ